ncbi:MAG: tetratricopeptide repeat protein [Candidatus Zhuqueibacterota bacterium]
MSEMLGNQYFLTRKYALAARELESALVKDPRSKVIRRKLIICFIQTGNIDKAEELFLDLVQQDVSFIIESDPIIDDCPCPELVNDVEAQIAGEKNSPSYMLKLGMLWLYCDIRKSIHYFTSLQKIEPNNQMVKIVLFHLKSFLLSKEVL